MTFLKQYWYYFLIGVLAILLIAIIYNSCDKTEITNNERNDSLEQVIKIKDLKIAQQDTTIAAPQGMIRDNETVTE